MNNVSAKSFPRGAGPGNQGQAKSKQSPAMPKRRVTIAPVGRTWPTTLYTQYTAAQQRFITSRIIKYDGFINV
jgi:hypothetical protein